MAEVYNSSAPEPSQRLGMDACSVFVRVAIEGRIFTRCDPEEKVFLTCDATPQTEDVGYENTYDASSDARCKIGVVHPTRQHSALRIGANGAGKPQVWDTKTQHRRLRRA
jgi:hypothetical protein